ncbi:MAG: signal peptidase II [Microbacterium sp.]|nr:signal peptidase II [Microbacterium sp.]MBN9154727.1 signal peptidase II [Microbacterium sp.]MBN9170655.1 signal peptidase II [Microbacterium sp.]
MTTPPDRARRFAFALAVAAGVILVDQVSKALAITKLVEGTRIPVFGNAFGLQLAFNPGAVLSIGSGATWLFTALGTVAVVLLGYAATRTRNMGWAAGIGLILGGAVGNLIDRVFAPPSFGKGLVTDFLAYGNVFIGNLADVALGAGVVLIAILLWHERRTRGDSSARANDGG